jgi:hypothetical protein
MQQKTKLSKPFHRRFIKSKGGSFKADYVSHSTVTEFLIGIIGNFSWQHVCWIHGKDGALEGGVFRLTATIDGQQVVIEECGAVERPAPNAGERAKDISSDAIKRCAMRLGLGLHLWSQDDYILYNTLSKGEDDA